jgi:eukaryotic-like serine/threonine-protein kinase
VPTAADRNLLFGILALQMDFISRDALVQAMNAWVLEKAKPLAQILVEQQALSATRRGMLEPLVEEHIKQHGNDAEKSLAAVSCVGSVRDELKQIADLDLQASLLTVTAALTPEDPYDAPDHASAGELTSAGQRFRILRPHAKGGLGEVFVARDEELHREVALKQIQDRHAHDSHSRARFLVEAEVTGGLEHPGVVPVYGLGQYADGRPFYAMRFIKGDSLKEAIDRYHKTPNRDAGERALEFRRLLGRFVDVCNAIAYAHSRGVLHRDLKPGNVMLGPYGETLVVDWGLAKVVGRREGAATSDEATLRPEAARGSAPTLAGSAIGTPQFMSPEQAAGKLDQLGPATDVYSLGATLYCLLTGRVPFQEVDVGLLLERVRRGEFQSPRTLRRDVPRALEAICLKAMSLRAEDRYASARAVADDIEHWLADEPVSAYREPLTTRLGRWSRRHRALVTGAASLLVTAVVLLTVGILALQREQRRTEQANADLVVALEAEAKRRQQARDALDAMSSQIVDDWLARQQAKDLTEEQKRFLHKALEAYEEFARDTGQDEASRAGLAAAHLRVGNIRSKLGQMADAEAAYRRAVEVFAPLTADSPSVPQYRQSLAETHDNLGALLQFTGRPKEAETDYRDALALEKQLAADFPTVPDYRRNLAAFQGNLGLLLRSTGRLKDAEIAYRDALAIGKQLAADFPTVPKYRLDLAYTHASLGDLLRAMARPKEAEAVCRDALALNKQLAADFPTVPKYRSDLAGSHTNLGILLQTTGRSKEAEAAYRDALALEKQLAAAFRTVPDYQNSLAGALVNLGDLLSARKEHAAARGIYEEAFPHHQAALQANPRHPDYRQFFRNNHLELTRTLIELGEHNAAAVAASQLLKGAVDPALDAYDAACFLALCVSLAEKDKQLSDSKRKELAQSYGDKAMAALRQAIRNGYKDAAHMKKDTDLDALRGRDDFKKLLGDLEANPKDP